MSSTYIIGNLQNEVVRVSRVSVTESHVYRRRDCVVRTHKVIRMDGSRGHCHACLGLLEGLSREHEVVGLAVGLIGSHSG